MSPGIEQYQWQQLKQHMALLAAQVGNAGPTSQTPQSTRETHLDTVHGPGGPCC